MHIAILEDLAVAPERLKAAMAPFEKEGHTFSLYERTGDLKVLGKEVRSAQAVILANMPLPAEAIAGAERLRFIDIAFTGTDHVDVAAAKAKGIAVSNASGYSTRAVSELAVGMAISLLRELPVQEARVREGKAKLPSPGREMAGKTVGIVGTGAIGQYSARLFSAFGCRVLGTSRTVTEGEKAGIAHLPLARLLEEADIVVLHCPLHASTRGLIGKDAFRHIKKEAILINVARGPVVDTEALLEALREGRIAGCGVDVFDTEPPLAADSPVLEAERAILAPHIGYYTREAMEDRLDIVFRNLRAFLDGRQENAV